MEETMERIDKDVENLEFVEGLLFTAFIACTCDDVVQDLEVQNKITRVKDVFIQKAESKGDKAFGEAIIYGLKEIGHYVIDNMTHFEAIMEKVEEIAKQLDQLYEDE